MALTNDLRGLPGELREWRHDVAEDLEQAVRRNRRLDYVLDLRTVLSAVVVTLVVAGILRLAGVSALIGTLFALVVLAVAIFVVAEIRREPPPRQPVRRQC